MASIKKDIVANLIGKVWSAAIAILLIPQYISFLGIESYGLIGFYATLIGSMAVLDLGLSTTLNRELAKYKVENRSVENIRDLSFSLERIYWLIGVVICIGVILLSGPIARHWVKAETLPVSVVRQSVILMGVVVAFQWPISLYNGGLTGLQKQVLNNSITVVMSTIRAAGVLLILKYFSATLEAFFIWQAATSAVFVFILRWNFWKHMPAFIRRARFSGVQLKTVWRFAAGMTGISFITFFIAQIDKIILSKLLPLSQFGYYSLAFTVATSVTLIVGPVSLTFFPRFTGLIAGRDEDSLVKLYHKACQLMSTLIFPICCVLLFFMKDILLIWTRNPDTTEHSYLIAQVLVIGSMFNSLMVMPYNLLLANGWTKFTIYQNSIAAAILVPLLFVLTHFYGALGAAWVWVTLNAGYVLISQPLMHRKLLKGQLKKWYLKDTLLPMAISFATVFLIRITLTHFMGEKPVPVLLVGLLSAVTLGVSVACMPAALQTIKRVLKFN